MKKRVISLILLIAALLLAPPTLAEEPPAPKEAFLVGFAQDTLDNDWRSAQVRDLQEAFATHPEIRFIFTNARGQTAQQIKDMEDLVDQGVDLLITSPRDGVAMEPAISAIHRRGIPVILLTRGIPGKEFTSFIAPDDTAIAAQAAELLASRLKGKGRILVLQGVPTSSTAIRRTKGFEEALKRYPGVSIAATRVGNYLRADALNEMEKVQAEGIAFDAIYAQSDSMASGARMALRAAGLDPKSIPIVGIDYINEARNAIRKGEQFASFTYPTCGREAMEQAVRILSGKPFKREVKVESVRVTRENVDDIEPIF